MWYGGVVYFFRAEATCGGINLDRESNAALGLISTRVVLGPKWKATSGKREAARLCGEMWEAARRWGGLNGVACWERCLM